MGRRFYIVLVWCVCLALLIPYTSLADEKRQTESNVIKLAALLPMSGELASKGEIRKFAIEKGIEDANKNWQAKGLNLQFELTVEDSESNPEIILLKAEQLREEGHDIFIAGSSAEVEALQPWSTENGTIVISYSSTSPGLGIEDDGIFRMVPNDTEQAQALASLLEYEGIYGIVPVYRDDIYGRELSQLLTEEFKQLYGTVAQPVAYQAENTNWEKVVGQISNAVHSLQMEKERVAIVLISFDEAADILTQSRQMDHLDTIRWFGSDTVTLSPIILEDRDIAKTASDMNLTGVTFGIPDSPLYDSLRSELEAGTDGSYLPDALFAYDIPGMLASVIEQMNEPMSAEALKHHMIEGSEAYAGVTGWTLLNEKGDRQYYRYDVWQAQAENEDYTWQQTAKYVNNPGTPGYIVPMNPSNSGSDQDLNFLFGYEGQEFDPERTLSRAEFTYMLMNATHTSTATQEAQFADSNDIDPRAKEAVALAQQEGIITGYGNEDFRPNQDITWIEAIAMIVRAQQWSLNSQIDVELDGIVPKWAESYVGSAMDHHLITYHDEFENIINGPLLFGDAMQMMIELIKGD